jgi:hypothetical protein
MKTVAVGLLADLVDVGACDRHALRRQQSDDARRADVKVISRRTAMRTRPVRQEGHSSSFQLGMRGASLLSRGAAGAAASLGGDDRRSRTGGGRSEMHDNGNWIKARPAQSNDRSKHHNSEDSGTEQPDPHAAPKPPLHPAPEEFDFDLMRDDVGVGSDELDRGIPKALQSGSRP